MEIPSFGKTATLTPDRADQVQAIEDDSPVALMWAGPPITYLKQGIAFRASDLPRFFDDYIKSCPAVADLLVPLDDYMSSVREVRRVGSQLWLAAKTTAEYFNRRNP